MKSILIAVTSPASITF